MAKKEKKIIMIMMLHKVIMHRYTGSPSKILPSPREPIINQSYEKNKPDDQSPSRRVLDCSPCSSPSGTTPFSRVSESASGGVRVGTVGVPADGSD